jgi:head-tail adaptor
MRFRLGPRIFEIAAVLDIGERHRLLRCLCREDLL